MSLEANPRFIRVPSPLRLTLLAITCLVMCTSSPTAVADVITLTNGNKIRGKIKSEIADLVVFELPYGTMRIHRREIKEIQRESEAEYLEKAGQDLLRHRDLVVGVEYLRKAHEESPTASTRRSLVSALDLRAKKSLEQRRIDAAQRDNAEALSLDRESAAARKTQDAIRKAVEALTRLETRAEEAMIDQEAAIAHEAIQQLMNEYPERRQSWREHYARLSVVQGHAEMRKSRFAEARDLYLTALEHNPDLIEYLHIPLGFCEIQTVVPILEGGQYDRARKRLTEASHVLPGNPAILYYLALTEQSAGNLSRAAELYAILAGPENRTIQNEKHIVALKEAAEAQLAATTNIELPKPVRRWSESVSKKGTLETRNFIIHYTIKDRAREVERHLEHHFIRMRKKWFRGALPLRAKVNIYLHPDRSSFSDAVSPPSWSSGITRHEYRFGRCFSHEVHFDASAAQFLSSTLPHELCHVLIPAVVGDGQPPPLWLDEGLATTEEPEFKQRYFRRVVRDALEDSTIFPMASLFAMKDYPAESRASLFYAQSNSITRYLIHKLGLKDALKLLRDLTVGPVNQVVAEHPAFTTLGHLEGSWRRWAAQDQ